METIKKTDRLTNILFVDNDNTLIHDLKDWLRKAEVESKYNMNFIAVQDAKTALKKLAEMSINLVILEITLPIVSGYYLINAIRKLNKDMPIIVYTKLKKSQDLAKIAESGVNNIFLKEFTKADELIEAIRTKATADNLDKVVIELNSKIRALSSITSQQELKLTQCPQCHLILAPDSYFCNNCGQKIFKKSKKIFVEDAKKNKEGREVKDEVKKATK
ncbi:MAG: response regulator [Patescibacteria group bacterium]